MNLHFFNNFDNIFIYYRKVLYLYKQTNVMVTLVEFKEAIANGYDSVFYTALNEGILPEISLTEGLQVAAHNERFEYIKELVERGADPHDIGDLAFRFACNQNSLKVVKYFVEEVGVESVDSLILGLKNALKSKRFKIVRYLLTIDEIVNDICNMNHETFYTDITSVPLPSLIFMFNNDLFKNKIISLGYDQMPFVYRIFIVGYMRVKSEKEIKHILSVM